MCIWYEWEVEVMARKSIRIIFKLRFFPGYLAKIDLQHILPISTKQILIALLIILLIICNPHHQISLSSQAQVQNPSPETLVEQGKKLYETEKLSDAIIVLEKAATLFQAKSDRLGEAMTLTNISIVLKKLGQLEKAEIKITEALNIFKNSKFNLNDNNTRKILAEALEIQGQIQLESGKVEQAIDSWKTSTNTYELIKDELGITRSLINQSIALQTLGFYRQSRTILNKIYPRLQKQPDTQIKAKVLRSLGDVLQLLGELEDSNKLLEQSLNIAKKLQYPPEISATLISLGNAQVALGKREISPNEVIHYDDITPLNCIKNKTVTQSPALIKFYDRAEQFYSEAASISTSPLLQVQAQLNQLSVLQELQKWSSAQKLAVEIQSKLKKIGLNQASIYAQINLARNSICLKTININTATWQEIAQELAYSIQQARNIHDKRSEAYALGVLGRVYLENKDISNAQKLTEQALIASQFINAKDINYLWQWQLGYIFNLKDDKDKAINYYTEAVNSLKFLRSDLVALNPDIQFSFRDNVEPIYRQFIDLLLQGKKDKNKGNDSLENNQKKLILAREALESLQLSELENFFREACLLPKPKQIDDVVDKTDSTAAVIYPIILKDRLEIILKLPNQSQLRHYTTYQSADKVENTLQQLQLYVKEPDRINDVKKLSSQIYQWLIQPLESDLANQPIKTLVFVLDGSLRNIPMGVIYNEKQGNYLIQKYAIALAPGLQLIDPKVLQRENLNVLAAGISQQIQIEGRSFALLINVKAELDRVQAMIPTTEELLNENFTKTNIENQIQKSLYTVVHIASHGEFSSNADKTFIVAWKELLKAKYFDNLLRRGESKSRAVELLVLSACQTASGDKRATLGLAGIAVRAGARSTVATLWSVDDESTAELMSEFYRELATTTLSKAEALRHAQLALLDKHETPYYWAPYILVGNWL